MAEQRQSFRFRLPWLSSQRTTAQPQRPRPTSETSRPPSQPTTAVVIQRPVSRPAGRAPTQPPPPQTQPPAKAEPESRPPPSPSAEAAKPPSPPPAAAESPKITSPSAATAAATESPKDASPSRAATEAAAATSKLASPETAKADSDLPPSPSRAASQKPTAEVSSPDKSQPIDQEDVPGASLAPTQTQKPAPQEEPGKPTSQPPSREPKPEVEITSQAKEETETESKEPEGKKETTPEILEEEKTDKATTEEEPIQKSGIEAKRDTKEKQIKTVIPSQPTEGTASTTFQRPFSFTEEEESPQQREIKEEISKLVRRLTTGPQLDDKPVTVITLTGENRGASMQWSSEARKKRSIHIHSGYKTNPDESPESTTDGEVRTSRRRFKDQAASEPTAYVNSNAQTVNNSIVFEASVTERSPGVYLSFFQDASEDVKSNGKLESVQTRKAEFLPTPSEMLTHQPNVRRRCLRGLFMEPSDSDPDNPDKPRRHGCRYGSCGERSKDKEIM